MTHGRMILGVNVLGLGQRPAAWMSEGLPDLAFIDHDYWQSVARLAERGTLDAIFLADSPSLSADPRLRPGGSLEPTTILASMAAATEHIGLIGTASTTFNDPVELAERFLSLDVVSGGRAGWNAVTTRGRANAVNFGLDDVPHRDDRYDRAYAFVEAVLALWRDAGTGRDTVVDDGFFAFQGRLQSPPSPQGQPILVQAGGSPQGRVLAGRLADAVFTAEMTFDSALVHYELVKAEALGAGRARDDVSILPGFALVIGSTEEEAVRRYDELESRAPSSYSQDRLSGILGVDVSALDPDAELPAEIGLVPDDPRAFAGSLAFRETTVRFAREGRLTVRQLLREYGGYGHPIIVGTPERIADTFETWFREGAADGFNLMPDVFPDGLAAVVDELVPLLRRRGLVREAYDDTTVRGRWRG